MKGLIIILTTLISVSAFASHNHGNMNMKNMKKMNKSSIKMNSSKFLLPYFAIHSRLIKDELPTKKEIQALEKSLNKEISINKHKDAKKELKKALKFVKEMKNKNLKGVRVEFYELSKVLIPFSKKHNLKGIQAYYCPMAKKTWLQNQSDITYNPYMPKKMLHCGSKI